MSDIVRAPRSAMIALSQPRDGPASDDDDKVGGGNAEARPRFGAGGVGESSVSGAAARKPRGRPPGSKNKPKPPVVITKESESAMQPALLELAGGSDVVNGVSDFARRRHVGVSILGGSGTVADVTFRHPSPDGPANVPVPGLFDILSITGTFLPQPPASAVSPAAAAAPPRAARPPPLTVSLAGPHGQVIGGTVAGPMTAVGPVVLVAATFAKPEFHRLPMAEEDEEAAKEEDVPEALPAPGGATLLSRQLPHPESVLLAQPSASHPPPHAHPPPRY